MYYSENQLLKNLFSSYLRKMNNVLKNLSVLIHFTRILDILKLYRKWKRYLGIIRQTVERGMRNWNDAVRTLKEQLF